MRPGISSDAWALGCVAAFCLGGRPLFYGSKESVREQHGDFMEVFYFDDKDECRRDIGSYSNIDKGVKFGQHEGVRLFTQLLQGHAAPCIGDDQPTRFRRHERAFLRGLLHPNPAERLGT